jgi:phosphoglycerol transferase MdoB-like AlkP superfamily enzyme
MTDWYPWVVTAHVIGAFGFVMAHGVSAIVAFRLPRAASADEARQLLGLSSASLSVAYASLLVLLAAGIAAGFMGSWWGHAWIWISIGVLLLVAVLMYAVGTSYYVGIRKALAADADALADGPGAARAAAFDVTALSASRRGYALALIGGVGLAVLVALMELKPG